MIFQNVLIKEFVGTSIFYRRVERKKQVSNIMEGEGEGSEISQIFVDSSLEVLLIFLRHCYYFYAYLYHYLTCEI